MPIPASALPPRPRLAPAALAAKIKRMAHCPHPTDVHVGIRVRAARIAAGLSQEKLGEALNLTFQQIQKYEKGVNRIAPSRLEQVARLTRRPVSWFFEGIAASASAAADAPPDPCTILAATRDGLALARAFNAIENAEMRNLIVRLAEITARKAGAP